MGVLFEDDFLDGFGTWPLAYIPYGGPDFGELSAVAQTVGRGDVDAYYAAWMAAGNRTFAVRSDDIVSVFYGAIRRKTAF